MIALEGEMLKEEAEGEVINNREPEEQKDNQSASDKEESYEVRIVEEKENVIFDRKEVKGEIYSSKGTPSKNYVMSYLSSKYKQPHENIDLKYVVNRPRRRVSEFFALVYSKPIKPQQREGGE